jgi:DNA-binding MarR family transcriptional regulator
MTRTYALKRLLEHGPMTPKQIRDCTRWTLKQVHQVLDCLLSNELVRRVGNEYEVSN